jgi:hypothetical protein
MGVRVRGHINMRHLAQLVTVVAIGAATAALVSGNAVSQETQSGPRVPVIAELFTSEGCSSCPAADELLRRLLSEQPVEGVEVLGLSNHVDYWDRLGWRDPFSSPFFSARQSTYSSDVFNSQDVYTPQLVVNGSLQAIGSDTNAVRRILRQAAERPRAAVTVAATEKDRVARIAVRIDVPENVSHGTADIVVAVAENGLATLVRGGENGGRMLSHAGVVRTLTTVGRLDADARTASASTSLTLAPGWRLEQLRFVGFVQEQASHRIFGGGAAALPHTR